MVAAGTTTFGGGGHQRQHALSQAEQKEGLGVNQHQLALLREISLLARPDLRSEPNSVVSSSSALGSTSNHAQAGLAQAIDRLLYGADHGPQDSRHQPCTPSINIALIVNIPKAELHTSCRSSGN